jgi:hypothetical protein
MSRRSQRGSWTWSWRLRMLGKRWQRRKRRAEEREMARRGMTPSRCVRDKQYGRNDHGYTSLSRLFNKRRRSVARGDMRDGGRLYRAIIALLLAAVLILAMTRGW